MKFEDALPFARQLDKNDPLKDYRKQFYIPKIKGKEVIYFCGNSLGLQPKTAEKHLKEELQDWKDLGVEGHIHGKKPWLHYHHFFTRSISKLTGARPGETVVMNQLTVNLNLLLISFYRPTPIGGVGAKSSGKRNKILVQANEFPSDYYAIEQQIKLHGLSPDECIVEVQPREGEATLRTEDILQQIEKYKDELALVMFSAVNYYTGQFFEIKKISDKCKQHGITIGLDLAHAIGNVELKLHEWNIDFATWCSYKYLNSGPGGVSGVFVHERHAKNFDLPRLAGWWGNEEKTRFDMPKNFAPQAGAAGWQISNAPILSMAAHKASLEIFDKAGIKALRKKSVELTAYLEFLLHLKSGISDPQYSIITPSNKKERGAHLSIQLKKNGKKIFDKLMKAAVVVDWREPDQPGQTGVIRVAPVPLYNTFEEVYRFAHLFRTLSV